MSSLDQGMNLDEIERLGHELQDVYASEIRRFIGQIERLVGNAGQSWIGKDASDFRSWWPAKKSKLQAIAEELHGYGQSALNNAAEQRQASGEGSTASQGEQVSTAALLGQLKEKYEDLSSKADLLKHWDDLGKDFRIKDLMGFSRKIDFGNAVGAGLWGVDVVHWVDGWDEKSGFDTVRDGVGLAIDGAGVAIWQVAAMKFTWDRSFEFGGNVSDFAERHWDISSAFEASSIARTGQAPTPDHYAGPVGLINYVGDGFKNAFSAKAWGF